MVVNMFAGALTYALSMLINFFLSPYIVENIGVDANGFFGLANNFVSYASLITIALNTLASRFITISIYQNNNKNANCYFSSVFFSNLFLSGILAAVGFIIVVFLNRFVDVPDNILPDVIILFLLSFINCIIGTISSVYSVATFARNKLYLSSLRSIESNILRVLCIVMLFSFLSPKLYYVTIASVISSLYNFFINIIYTKRLLPEIKLSVRNFRIKMVKELVLGGIWATLNKIGTLLLDGLDLLLSNLFIDATAMGVLSLSKTIPSSITGIVSSVVSIFSPNYTILYAQGKKEELLKFIKQTMKIMGITVNVPVIILIICGKEFYKLWQPTVDSNDLYRLSILGCACIIISGGINCIYNLFIVVNKLKANSLVVIFSGLLNALTTFLLLKYTNLGVYAIAGTSTIISIFRNLLFTAPYGAKCLGLKWYTFYPDIVKPFLYVCLTVLFCHFTVSNFIAESWILLIIKGIITVIVSVLIGYFIVLNKVERKLVTNIVKSKLKRVKEN